MFWWRLVIMIVAELLVQALTPKPKVQFDKTAKVPVSKEGVRLGKIYGTCWIDDPQVCAFKQVNIGEDKIKAKGGKK
jgi:hypothetical protein